MFECEQIFKTIGDGTFETLHEIQKAIAKSIIKLSIIKSFQKLSQGPPNPWLRSAKVQKEDFLKKSLAGSEKIFLFWDHMNPSNAWVSKLEVEVFFTI